MSDPCTVLVAVEFVAKHRNAAELLAKQYNVPTENILGLAAHESQHGVGRIAKDNNNFFSMHAPAPLQIGEDVARGNSKVRVAKFSSFYQSGQSFLIRFGPAIKGKSNPQDFAEALIKAHFNSGSSANGGRDGYAAFLVQAIKKVKARMGCVK